MIRVFFKDTVNLITGYKEFGEEKLKCDIYNGDYAMLKKFFKKLVAGCKAQ